MKTLIAIVGPTAIGKTALSISLAQHFGCEIISSDSRQFFQEMHIGTAVPSQAELETVQHHFVQNKTIFEPYSVGTFEKEAITKLDQLFEKQDVVVMVGGSGLYIDAVVFGLDLFPEIQVEVRNELATEFATNGIEFLLQKLQTLDPQYYQHLLAENPQTLQNPQRMMRFVEVCVGTKMPYSSFLKSKTTQRNFETIWIGLEGNRNTIYNRINKRVDTMIEEGLLAEAEMLYPNKNLNALQTVGYRELFSFFEGQMSLEFAIEEIKKNTRRFAKRQLTWFKRNKNITWFDFEIDQNIIKNHIFEKINKPV